MGIEPEGGEQSGSMAFLGRSAVLNALFATEAAASFLLDVIVAAAFGLSAQTDALYAAYALPQKVGRGMFQSLTNSFMGLFGDRQDKRVAYNQAISVIGAASVVLSLILAATSAWWLPVTIPGAAADTQRSAVPLAQVFAWLVGFLALAETLRAIYYQEGRVWVPSLARVLGIALSIAILLVAKARQSLELAAWGMTLGAGAEALLGLLCMPWLLRGGYRFAWPERSRLREMVAVVGTPLAGQATHVLSGIGEQMLASLLPTGSITAVNYAKRIINTLERFVFRGFLISTIRSHSENGRPDLRANFRLLMLVAVPIMAVLAALSVPMVSVLFGRGRFSSEDVRSLAMAIQVFAPAILGLAVSRIPVGMAYARKRVGTLFISSVLSSVALLAAEAAFIHMGLGLRSFGLATTVSVVVGLAWLYFTILRPEPARLLDRADVWRIVAVGLSAWAGAALPSFLAGSSGLSGLAAGLTGCGLFFALSAYVLGFDEARQVLKAVKRIRR